MTEVLPPFETTVARVEGGPPGNWIYHCHYAVHLSGLVALDTENGGLDTTMLMHHGSDRPHQMFGLVMGITVAPKGVQARYDGPTRAIRIQQREKPNVYGDATGHVVRGGRNARSREPERALDPGTDARPRARQAGRGHDRQSVGRPRLRYIGTASSSRAIPTAFRA